VRFGHFVLSHLFPIVRDVERLQQIIPRCNKSPLGCGALAGNAFGVDRESIRVDLGMDGLTENSLDAVCDRDFVVDFLFWHSTFLMHISQ
jgi:argininosuccinate lyase